MVAPVMRFHALPPGVRVLPPRARVVGPRFRLLPAPILPRIAVTAGRAGLDARTIGAVLLIVGLAGVVLATLLGPLRRPRLG